VYTYAASDPDETVLDFSSNWWGVDNASTVQSRVHDHADSSSSPVVDWCPHLVSAPPPSVPADVECPQLVICDGDVVWGETSRPYLLISDVYVCPGRTLNIFPGVEVRSLYHSSGIEILVEGDLIAFGTAASPVTFISHESVPGNRDWRGITFQGDGWGTFLKATIQHASNGITVRDSSFLSLTDVAVTDGGSAGIYVAGNAGVGLINVQAKRTDLGLSINGSPRVVAVGCTFTDNLNYGVMVDGDASYDPSVEIVSSSLHSNLGSYDLYASQVASPDTHIIWVPDCWWGTEDVSEIASRIYDHADNSSSPRVYFNPYGPNCEQALGRDHDDDGVGDFEDNCPIDANSAQTDTDVDGMGDPCDPDPGVGPTGDCDGTDDSSDGYADADSDDWGDPCDCQPTRGDSNPGEVEGCDGRDNNCGTTPYINEFYDYDLDGNIACSDCDPGDPNVNTCACEDCTNLFDDDCDDLVDGADPSCWTSDTCILFTAPGPGITLYKGSCGAPVPTLVYDLVRGDVGQLGFSDGSVDLGRVECVDDLLADRHTDTSAVPDPICDDTPVVFYLVKDDGDPDFGTARSGEHRDTWDCIP
jgi:hypothetical protein